MAVLAIFNILSANPMVTTLDAVLEAFRPPDRERDRDKRPGPRPLTIARTWPTAIAMLGVKRANLRGCARTCARKSGARGPRAAAVTVFVKQNGPLPPELAEHAGHPSISNILLQIVMRNPLSRSTAFC